MDKKCISAGFNLMFTQQDGSTMVDEILTYLSMKEQKSHQRARPVHYQLVKQWTPSFNAEHASGGLFSSDEVD